MQLHPILTALRRNKVGAIVICVQMAITLAILCNALFIIEQRLASSARPTGTVEAELFAIDNEWVGAATDLPARARADIAALRSLPDVADAYSTASYPLENGGWLQGVAIKPNQDDETAQATTYFGDEHMLPTLGLKLVADRNFNAVDIGEHTSNEAPVSPGIIVTRALADKLFPDGSALGRSVYIESPDRGMPIVGIVDRLAAPWTRIEAADVYENSVIEPFRYADKAGSYMVRAKPHRLAAAMQAAQVKLDEVNGARVLSKVRSFAQLRATAYRDDRGLAIILGVVCAALVAVTAFGIVGLTSYWVAQRRRQIGIRRALGATRSAIVRYFQIENLLIAGVSAGLGAGLAVSINLWMVQGFAMTRLSPGYVLAGAVLVLLLGQVSVLWPALRAASIAPALATRGA